MAQQDFMNVKCVVRSILTSSPVSMTISQLLDDYFKYEGSFLPFKELGYSSCFDLLLDIDDVLKIPDKPNYLSEIQLVVDSKISHIRELISKQRPQKTSHKTIRKFATTNPFKKKNNNTYNNFDKNNINNTTITYNARGYNFVKQKSLSSPQPKGFVTSALQHDIEELCRNSKHTSVHLLKQFLINHQDYKKLNVFNIEEAIQLLKYFIYIDKGGVHLKDSEHEIFNRNNSMSRDNLIETLANEEKLFLYDDTSMIDVEFEDDEHYGLESTVNSNYETANESTNLNTSNNENIDYKKIIASIIVNSKQPITVNELLMEFEKIYGYKFPFQKFSCRTCMDYFRLSSATFKLDDLYSANSVIRLKEKPTQTSRNYTIRGQFVAASSYPEYDDSENFVSIYEEFLEESSLKNINYQQMNYSDLNASSNLTSSSFESLDSDMVLNSMKAKMRYLLSKHKNGIPCNEFMDVYENEFGSGFVYSEYGFKSMKDMAYQLPSVFYVKDNDDFNKCILYNAHRRNELENNLNDPTEFYKNIPKTVLCNFSNFFKNYSGGVDLNNLETLYCSEYGRSYEPIKYGYSSEKHMFESLNKMVEVRGNVVYTIDPYAYRSFFKNKDLEDLEDQNSKIPPVFLNTSLLKDCHDICGLNFEYSKFNMRKKKLIKVYIAEIYKPSLFYLQMASDVHKLNFFMKELQSFYNTNEEKYKLLPELVQVRLPCVSCFEDTGLWHRAKVIKIVDDLRVQVFYVDYGSVEIVDKSNIRLLEISFGAMPIQSIPCTLFENCTTFFNRKICDRFAEMIDNGQPVEATIKDTILIDNTDTYVVDLYLYLKDVKVSVNKAIEDDLKKQAYETQKSARTFVCEVINQERKLCPPTDYDDDDDNDTFHSDSENEEK